MHDPLVMIRSFDRPSVRSAWRRWRKPRSRWKIGSRRHRLWRNVTVNFIDLWHREPNDHDSGTVCARNRRWLHVHHWHIRFWPVFRLRRWLFSRCGECGRRFSWHYAPVSHQWGGNGPGWWFSKGESHTYHGECSSLVSLRRQKATDEALIRELAAVARVHADVSEPELIELVRKRDNFHQHYRLEKVLGWDRDDSYSLVPADSGTRKRQPNPASSGSDGADA